VFWSDVDTTAAPEAEGAAKKPKVEIDLNQITAAINAPVSSSSALPPSKSGATSRVTATEIAVKSEPATSTAPPAPSSSSAPAAQITVKEEEEEDEVEEEELEVEEDQEEEIKKKLEDGFHAPNLDDLLKNDTLTVLKKFTSSLSQSKKLKSSIISFLL